jgi:hypothetical protein
MFFVRHNTKTIFYDPKRIYIKENVYYNEKISKKEARFIVENDGYALMIPSYDKENDLVLTVVNATKIKNWFDKQK